MAIKSKLGNVSSMSIGTVKYAMKKCKDNGNTSSKYYATLKDRFAELGGR